MDIVERMESCGNDDYDQCEGCPHVEYCDRAKANKEDYLSTKGCDDYHAQKDIESERDSQIILEKKGVN